MPPDAWKTANMTFCWCQQTSPDDAGDGEVVVTGDGDGFVVCAGLGEGDGFVVCAGLGDGEGEGVCTTGDGDVCETGTGEAPGRHCQYH